MVKLMKARLFWVFLLVIIVVAFGQRYLTRLATGQPRPKEEMLSRTLVKSVGRSVLEYYGAYHRIPTGELSQVYLVLLGTNVLGQNPRNQSFVFRPFSEI